MLLIILAWLQLIIIVNMSSAINRSSSLHENVAFAQKIKEINTNILPSLPEDKQGALKTYLEELSELHSKEIAQIQEKYKANGGKLLQLQTKIQVQDESPRRGQKKTALQVRGDKGMINGVLVQDRRVHKSRSPQKKQQVKKYAKFVPKKLTEEELAIKQAHKLKGVPQHKKA